MKISYLGEQMYFFHGNATIKFLSCGRLRSGMAENWKYGKTEKSVSKYIFVNLKIFERKK